LLRRNTAGFFPAIEYLNFRLALLAIVFGGIGHFQSRVDLMKRLLKYVASAAMLLSPFGRSRRQGPAAPCVQLDRRKYWRRLGQQQLDGHALPDELQHQQRRIHIVAA
jgi:hypothetical protein